MSILEASVDCGHYELEFLSDGSSYDSFSYRPVPDPTTGGVSVRIAIYNCGEKEIKYLKFTLIPYNAVGDIVASEIGDKIEGHCQITGPIPPREDVAFVHFENVWYNRTISKVEVKEVKIQYMDGTEETIHWEDVKDPFASDSEYNKDHPKEVEKKGGCYVATAVYGSYDCPQVWTLRRYRDFTLAETWYGRAFIHMYYAISPTVVKYFGDTRAFKDFFRPKLDKFVDKLNAEGVLNTEYDDRKW